MIVLDTNVSEAMKPEPNPAVLACLNDQAAETLYISSVTLAELLFGIQALPRPDGHPKLPHLWPVKLLQAGRSNYEASGLMAMRAAASLRR